MTREEILSLSGPALSEAVAEHVMGWTRMSFPPSVNMPGSTWATLSSEKAALEMAEKKHWWFIPSNSCQRNEFGLFSDPDGTGPAKIALVWEPHKDIRQAWEVFQNRRHKLFSKRTAFFKELGHLLQTQNAPQGPDDARCVTVAWPDAMMFLTPETICRAALLSVLSP